jgi:hypothetical protein
MIAYVRDDEMIMRIHQLEAEVNQKTREQLLDKAHEIQHNIQKSFDRKVRKEDF